MSEQEYKTMIVLCKRCGKEFKLHLPMHIYESMTAAEPEGETMSWVGTCPSCRKGDPSLRMLDEAGIATTGGDFIRRKK